MKKGLDALSMYGQWIEEIANKKQKKNKKQQKKKAN